MECLHLDMDRGTLQISFPTSRNDMTNVSEYVSSNDVFAILDQSGVTLQVSLIGQLAKMICYGIQARVSGYE